MRPHVHRCPECYEDAACGMPCTIIDDGLDDDGKRRPGLEGLPRGYHTVCGICEREAKAAS